MISEWGVTPFSNRVVKKYKVVHFLLFSPQMNKSPLNNNNNNSNNHGDHSMT